VVFTGAGLDHLAHTNFRIKFSDYSCILGCLLKVSCPKLILTITSHSTKLRERSTSSNSLVLFYSVTTIYLIYHEIFKYIEIEPQYFLHRGLVHWKTLVLITRRTT
jgi:hypothetical protein